MHVVDTTVFWAARGGGVATYLRQKQRVLTSLAGWRHTVVAPRCDLVDSHDVPGIALPIGYGYRIPLRVAPFKALIASLEPDVVEAGDPYHLGRASLTAARLSNAAAVAFCHSDMPRMCERLFGAWTAAPARRYLRRLYSRFDAVFAPSVAMANRLNEFGLTNVRVQALGVDTQTFHPRGRDSQWRANLGLPSDARLLMYAGRFAPEKNLQILADAVRLLGSPYYLVTIGAGPKPPRGDRVIALAYQADKQGLARALASADVFVHAGDQETFGLAAIEAMACGLPVVARAAAGLTELVDDSVGAPVRSPHASAFAEAIGAQFDDADRRRTRSQAARSRACRYDWQHVLPDLLAHYRALVGHDPSTSKTLAHAPPIDRDEADDMYRSA